MALRHDGTLARLVPKGVTRRPSGFLHSIATNPLPLMAAEAKMLAAAAHFHQYCSQLRQITSLRNNALAVDDLGLDAFGKISLVDIAWRFVAGLVRIAAHAFGQQRRRAYVCRLRGYLYCRFPDLALDRRGNAA